MFSLFLLHCTESPQLSSLTISAYGETLALEVAPFNIRVLTLIPGGFYTDSRGGTPLIPSNHIPDYEPLYDGLTKMLKTLPGTQIGDPKKYAHLVLDVVRGEGIMTTEDGGLRPWPKRLFVGSDAVRDARRTFEDWNKTMEEYTDLTRYTDIISQTSHS